MARIRTIDVQSLRIPFTRAFRHASAERSETASIWVHVVLDSAESGSGESCPREYVTGESLDTGRTFCRRVESSVRECITDLACARMWIESHTADIDRNPAAWCALELGILDALAKDAGESIEQFLSLPDLDGDFFYTAVLGDAKPDVFQTAAREYREFGFSTYKLKLSGDLERDRAKVAVMRALGVQATMVRVDANNLWNDADEAIRFLRSLDYPVAAVEEPLGPNDYTELARVADTLGCRIILDESLLRVEQLAQLPPPATRWIVNVRVSKMGGLLRSLAVVDQARAAGLGIIVGAQVGETSLLTRVALPVARAANLALVAQEGAFGTRLLTRDVCDPPLMFAHGGRLRTSAFPKLRGPGFGIV